MAGRGPRPSENPRRTNKHESVELSGTTVGSAPSLRNRHLYSAETLHWWDTWSVSPQAEAFLPTDWQRLMMLAPLVEQYWQEPRPSTLAEIRLNEERLGATIRDRQSLRMKVASAGGSSTDLPPEVADIAKYRAAYAA